MKRTRRLFPSALSAGGTHAPPGRLNKALAVAALLCLAASLPAWAQGTGTFPEKVFAPYVDVLNWPTFSISDMYNQTGQLYYTLAFITAGNNAEPTWGGVVSMEQDWYRDEIEAIRNAGGDVIISFGGANGTELALACSSVEELTAAYQSVIDRYDLSWVDFDIEGWAVGERTSVDRRNKAIKVLQDNNPDLKVAFCLPVLPSGLTADGLFVLTNAAENNVRIDVVNVMAMDYGDGAAPNPEGRMGQYAIDAAVNTRAQMQQAGVSGDLGVTPMIGQNDIVSERFYPSDAEALVSWANEPEQADWFSLLAFWSANRDNNGCPGGAAQPTCSGVAQEDFAFTEIFSGFGTGGGGNLRPNVSITSPADETSFPPGANIAITADASDPDGSVAQVQFYQGGTLISTDTAAPYEALLINAATGVYNLTAVATDDQGGTRTSSVVRAYVGDVCTAPAWKSGAIYVANDEVSYGGHMWMAKWWTQGETPGTTGQWGVWQDLGPCGENQPPDVSITAPADQETFPAGSDISVTADAYDPDGSIVAVDFYRGTILLGTDMSAPYEAVFAGAPAGSYSLTARATDNDGAVVTSVAVGIAVGNQPPQASITAPADQSVFDEGEDISVSATASDPDGSIAKVLFYQGATLLGTDDTAPYQVMFAAAPAGSYELTARAYDDQGATGTSAVIHVTVQGTGGGCEAPAWDASTVYWNGDTVSYAGRQWMAKWWTRGDTPGTTGLWGVWKDLGPCDQNLPPQVALTGPADGASFAPGADIALSAAASDPDGSIAKVEFYQGSTLLGTDAAAPYEAVFADVPAGSYVLTARAYDDQGAAVDSAPVGISVGNQAPQAAISAPADQAVFDEGEDITVSALASDPDGSVVLVEFYLGGTLLGTDDTAPYQALLADAMAGSYELTARAYDDQGAGGSSAVIHITVQAGGGGCTSPAWEASAIYWGGDTVSYGGHEWMAKWWTRGDTPGTTGLWGVWKDLGLCGE